MALRTWVLNSFRGGISPDNASGPPGSFKYGYGLQIRARNDSLTSKFAMSTESPTSMTDLMNFMVTGHDGTTYCFGSNGSIWSRTGSGSWTYNYTAEDGAIKGAAEFKGSDGLWYVYWATATQISRKPVLGNESTVWTDVVANYKTESILSTDWHPMISAGGNLMIGNDSFLSTLDYNGNFNPTALNLIPGNKIRCLNELADYVIIGTTKEDQAEEGFIWSWLVSATNWINKKKIPAKGVNALAFGEQLLAQAGSAGEIYSSNFSDTVSLVTIPGGGSVNPGSTTFENGVALLGLAGGTYPGIWSFGRRRQSHPIALMQDYRLNPTIGGSTVASIGSICMTNGTLLASWKATETDSNSYGVDALSTTNLADPQSTYESLEFDPGFKTTYEKVKVKMGPMPTGTEVAIKYKLNRVTTGGDSSAGAGFKYAIMGDGSTTHAVSSGKHSTEAEFIIHDVGQAYEVGAELYKSGATSPEIFSITTYYSEEGYIDG